MKRPTYLYHASYTVYQRIGTSNRFNLYSTTLDVQAADEADARALALPQAQRQEEAMLTQAQIMAGVRIAVDNLTVRLHTWDEEMAAAQTIEQGRALIARRRADLNAGRRSWGASGGRYSQ